MKKKWVAALLCAVMTVGLMQMPAGAGQQEPPSLSAKSAILVEPSSGLVLYEKDARRRMPMASTTKIMTALLALENAKLDDEVTVSDIVRTSEGSAMYLKVGEKITVQNLLYGLMLASGNDAALVLAEHVGGDVDGFVKMMNDKASSLGLNDTSFETPSGLDGENHYTTAADFANLTAYALENPEFCEIVGTQSVKVITGEMTRYLKNHNRLLSTYKGCIGVKTGFTKKSGRCLVSAAERDGITLIAVTLSAPDDWNDHKKLFDYGFTQVERVDLLAGADASYTVPVTGGEKDNIEARVPQEYIAIVRKGEAQGYHTVVELPRFLYAPVAAGDRVGRVVIYNGQQKVREFECVAAQSCEIPRSGFQKFIDKIRDLLFNILG